MRAVVLASGVALLAGLAACSSSGGGSAAGGSATAPGTRVTGSSAPAPSAPAATTSAPAALSVLVTNDDGVGAPGIATVVDALRALPDVTVTVVAPAKNQSGTGSKTTAGTVTYTAATTASGDTATAVNGYPADTIAVALDRLHLQPQLVVSGINLGQNLGPLSTISGTVGAAKAAVRRGIPALAVSAGVGATVDYRTAATYAIEWVKQHRDQLTGSPASGLTVANLNVPSCSSGSVRGEKQLPSQPSIPNLADALAKQDCTSTATPTTEVAAFDDGFATLTSLSAR